MAHEMDWKSLDCRFWRVAIGYVKQEHRGVFLGRSVKGHAPKVKLFDN